MDGTNQRRTERVSTVSVGSLPMALPVFYQILSPEGVPLDTEIRAGFTQDVSGSGLRLQLRHLPARLRHILHENAENLRLQLDLPLRDKRIRVETRVAWVKPDAGDSSDSLQVGVAFLNLAAEDGAAMLALAKREANRPKIRRRIFTGLSVMILLVTAALLFNHFRYVRAKNAMRETITALEDEALPDGTCQPTTRCGELKCCTWREGLCVCDSCCQDKAH